MGLLSSLWLCFVDIVVNVVVDVIGIDVVVVNVVVVPRRDVEEIKSENKLSHLSEDCPERTGTFWSKETPLV